MTMDVVYTYRVGGGLERFWSVCVTLDPLPPWATLAQIDHLARHSRPTSNYWVLRSGSGRKARAAACSQFERAIALQTSWAKTIVPGEQIAMGRIAPPDIVEKTTW